MEQSRDDAPGDEVVTRAREEFRVALIETHRLRTSIGDVEAAAAKYCRILRTRGCTPEYTLVDAKRVIEDAIDGSNAGVAERAVTSCIQHYFRD